MLDLFQIKSFFIIIIKFEGDLKDSVTANLAVQNHFLRSISLEANPDLSGVLIDIWCQMLG